MLVAAVVSAVVVVIQTQRYCLEGIQQVVTCLESRLCLIS